jgi:predicted esterase
VGIVEYRSKVFRYYGESRFREALEAAREAAEKFPDYDAKTSYWIACLENRLGNQEEAIQTLQSAAKRGIWWPAQSLEDPDLKSLRDRPDFKAVKTECERCMLEQRGRLEPELVVQTPADYADSPDWPALVVFHQRYGERPELSAQPWTSIVSNGRLLAALWSSQVYCSDGRCWDNLEDSEKDVKWGVSQLTTNYRIDSRNLIFGGFSQGGGLSIYSALARLAPTRGFIAVAPSDWVVPEIPAPERRQPSEAFSSFIKASDCTGLRGVIIMGDQDAFFPKIERLYEMMVDRGLDGKLLVEKGVGHEYPENFGTILTTAVDFVLGTSA